MGKLVPILLAVIGLAVGGGAGIFLRPAPEAPSPEAAADPHAVATPSGEEVPPEAQPEYVKLSNQFIVPIVADGRVNAMVIMALSVEVTPGSTEAVYAKEPKLRDAFLQVLFDHANAGGFRGSFTDGANLTLLRKALLEVAQSTMGDMVTDVLIADIARQDA
ncbi:flagellar basal body-associated FliL family protein [Rhodobacter ferrooxidans]|uniref:Flagellar protein FliL n=1 Tax=Rhodobacter ferrooxidans TaxID=371731 RepID=C8RX61_9RHOB|nr:flagellar basal body-associated FliL family protein [Rhodobacter sp. SW2]EEW26586.1 flagellar basal body-associated protein FliL [Rhodobacter sp. SW2]